MYVKLIGMEQRAPFRHIYIFYPTPRVGSKDPNIFFEMPGHVAYQIKGTET